MPNPHLSGTTWGGGWAFFPRTPQSSNQKEVGGALDWTGGKHPAPIHCYQGSGQRLELQTGFSFALHKSVTVGKLKGPRRTAQVAVGIGAQVSLVALISLHVISRQQDLAKQGSGDAESWRDPGGMQPGRRAPCLKSGSWPKLKTQNPGLADSRSPPSGRREPLPSRLPGARVAASSSCPWSEPQATPAFPGVGSLQDALGRVRSAVPSLRLSPLSLRNSK